MIYTIKVIFLFILATFIVFGFTYVFKRILERAGVEGSDWQGIICESDWYPSLSRAQFLTWTVIIAIAFVWILLLKFTSCNYETIDTFTSKIPENLLLLMGMTSFTTIASKGLSSFKYKGAKKKPKKPLSLWTMFQENEKPSLTRYQTFLWTLISIFTYFWIVLVHINAKDLTLPDCPQLLLALMGISQGTYLGGKLTFQPPEASISEIIPDNGIIGDIVTILGLNFGDKGQMGVVIFGETVVKTIDHWQNSMIRLTIPTDIKTDKNGMCKVKVVNESGSMTLPYEYKIKNIGN
jgi:hypothetical protein